MATPAGDVSIAATTLSLSVFVGGLVIILVLLWSWIKNKKSTDSDKRSTTRAANVGSAKGKNENQQRAKSKKKTAADQQQQQQQQQQQRRGRELKSMFSHPWLLTSLKGHGAKILDMDFSSNGKFLASCAEDPPPPQPPPPVQPQQQLVTLRQQQQLRGNSSSNNGGGDVIVETSSYHHRRRQQRRKSSSTSTLTDNSDSDSTASSSSGSRSSRGSLDSVGSGGSGVGSSSSSSSGSIGGGGNNKNGGGLSRRQRRNASKKKQQQRSDNNNNHNNNNKSNNNNNGSVKFYNKLGYDHGQLYRLLSAYVISRKQLKDCGFPIECSDSTNHPGGAFIKASNGFAAYGGNTPLGDGVIMRTCCRCQSSYLVRESGEYVTADPCVYHWGKLMRLSPTDSTLVYSCCRGYKETSGCSLGKLHVSVGPTFGYLDGFVKTSPCELIQRGNNYGVYALDCEMCFTTQGLEVVKVSLVKADGSIVYNSLVRPRNAIVDYNTRFSGMTSKQLGRATKTLQDVQRDLLKIVHAETILIGHSLENDLRALRVLHSNVVDTSLVFPHFYGLPYRRSLKSLVGIYLKKNIQTDVHNSVEDARSCLELMLWRLKNDSQKVISV